MGTDYLVLQIMFTVTSKTNTVYNTDYWCFQVTTRSLLLVENHVTAVMQVYATLSATSLCVLLADFATVLTGADRIMSS